MSIDGEAFRCYRKRLISCRFVQGFSELFHRIFVGFFRFMVGFAFFQTFLVRFFADFLLCLVGHTSGLPATDKNRQKPTRISDIISNKHP